MDETQNKERFWNKKWIKGMGMGAFLFFLVKGLIWLAIFFGAFKAFGS
jgi:hypothetical protein